MACAFAQLGVAGGGGEAEAEVGHRGLVAKYLALHLIATRHGPVVAARVARDMVV